MLNVAKDETSGDLDGWVTLVNHSGTAFKNASLQLVAGDLHRVMAQNGMDEMKAMGAVARRCPRRLLSSRNRSPNIISTR